jgi:hypothetical protein
LHTFAKKKYKNMPTLTATTTAVFSSIGLNATTIYTVFVGLVGSAVDFGLFLIQVSWPFLLGIAFIYLLWRLAHKFTGFGR